MWGFFSWDRDGGNRTGLGSRVLPANTHMQCRQVLGGGRSATPGLSSPGVRPTRPPFPGIRSSLWPGVPRSRRAELPTRGRGAPGGAELGQKCREEHQSSSKDLPSSRMAARSVSAPKCRGFGCFLRDMTSSSGPAIPRTI